MIDIPKEDQIKLFRVQFENGALFHIENYAFVDNTESDKYLLVMRGLREDGECYFYLPTSRVDKYRENPIYADNLYVFPVGSISHFSRETGIVVSSPHNRSYLMFQGRYFNGQKGKRLDYLGQVPDKHMRALSELIQSSDRVSDYDKRQLVSDKYWKDN